MYGWRQNRPDLDQIVPDESLLFIGPIIVLNRLEKVIGYCLEKCWKTIADQKPSFRGRLGRDRQRADETWGPSDDYGTTDFDRLLFLNIFKNRSRSLVRYPTLRGLRRSGQNFPPKEWGSAWQCSQIPDYVRPKKDRVLSGPKQSLVKWPLNLIIRCTIHIYVYIK